MAEDSADLIVRNVSAVAIHDGRLAATGTDREVTRFARIERVAEPSGHCSKTMSSDYLFQNVTSQLVAVFRGRGCALPVAEELAQKVTEEVKGRVRDVLRRPGLKPTWISGVIQVGDLTLDLERHIFWRRDDEVHLSPKEFELLALFMKNADVLLPHVTLLRSVWGLEYGGELEYLRTIVFTLRRKIEKKPAHPEYIVNEPGLGYCFRNPAGYAMRIAQTKRRLQPLEPATRRKVQGTGLPSAGCVHPPAPLSIGTSGDAR